MGIDAFSNCTGLTSVIIEKSLYCIRDNAFSHCHRLTSVTIPDSVIFIYTGAFAHCYSLTNVIIPNSVKNIGANAFSYCSNLTNVTLPDCETHICEGAFSHCQRLISVKIQNSETIIEPGAFAHCPGGLESITVTTEPTKALKDKFNSIKRSLEKMQVKIVSEKPVITSRFRRELEFQNYHVDKGIFVDTINPSKVLVMENEIEEEIKNQNGDVSEALEKIVSRITAMRP
jgi:hypothetical protein